jgi:hypothetical protein
MLTKENESKVMMMWYLHLIPRRFCLKHFSLNETYISQAEASRIHPVDRHLLSVESVEPVEPVEPECMDKLKQIILCKLIELKKNMMISRGICS